MKPSCSILTIVAFSGIAVGLFLFGNDGGTFGQHTANRASALGIPASRQREDLGTRDRFAGLDPALRKVVIQLEEANLEWDKGRPVPDWSGDRWNDWEDFSREKVSLLETQKILALVTWLERADCSASSAFEEFRSALFYVFAFRDHAACRSHLMEAAKSQGIGEDYDFYQAGFAANTPSEAWRIYLQDVSDPRIRPMMGSHLVQMIFKSYSATNPREAWDLVLRESDVRRCARMVEGYSYGAPAGENWRARYDEISTKFDPRGAEISNAFCSAIAERWLTEDPASALNWYIDQVDPEKPSASDENSASDGTEWTAESKAGKDRRSQLGERLLSQLYDSNEHRSASIMGVLENLLTNGESDVPAEFISKRVAASMSLYDIPLLQLIPKIKDPEIRACLFLRVVHALPTHGSNSSEYPTEVDRAVRRVALNMDLPPDVRAEVDEVLKDLEIQDKNSSSK